MNKLEIDDMCIPSNYEEYLEIHRKLEGCPGVSLLKTYNTRVRMGEVPYDEYPKLHCDWSNTVSGTHGPNGDYNLLTVKEFLTKAGFDTGVYMTGGPIKHKFI